MAVGIKTGYPIATAFTVTGAVVGVGLALGGTPVWAKYQQIGAVWADAGRRWRYRVRHRQRPPRADVPERFSVAALAGPRRGRDGERRVLVSLGSNGSAGSLVDAGQRLLGTDGTLAAVALSTLAAVAVAAFVYADIRRDETGGLRRVLLSLGSLVFSAGGSQVGLAVGPLLPLLDDVSAISPFVVPSAAAPASWSAPGPARRG